MLLHSCRFYSYRAYFKMFFSHFFYLRHYFKSPLCMKKHIVHTVFLVSFSFELVDWNDFNDLFVFCCVTLIVVKSVSPFMTLHWDVGTCTDSVDGEYVFLCCQIPSYLDWRVLFGQYPCKSIMIHCLDLICRVF